MIGDKFHGELKGKELREMMQNVAVKVEQRSMYVPLTAAEVDAKREQLTDTMIKLNAEEEEFDNVKSMHKAKIKPMKTLVASMLLEVRTGQEMKNGVFYDCANSEAGTMQTFDEHGVCVAERKLRPDEKGNSHLFVPSTGLNSYKITGTDNS